MGQSMVAGSFVVGRVIAGWARTERKVRIVAMLFLWALGVIVIEALVRAQEARSSN